VIEITDSDIFGVLGASGFNYWVGETAPLPGFIASNDVLVADKDFRLTSELHGSFDGVYYVEHDLGQSKQWRLILDELLRLMDGRGTLVLRYSQDVHFGTNELMNYLLAWTGNCATISFSRSWANSSSRVVGILVDMEPRHTSVSRVTFGVTVDGRFPDRLARFIESVANLTPLANVDTEIIVCGPAGCLDELSCDTRTAKLVIQDARFADAGWITRKKNMLVREAEGEIIVLAHDRYWFPSDFLIQLGAYGPDFDLLVPRQETTGGFTYPSLVATSDVWGADAVGVLDQGDFTPTVYVNGGILIARTDVLRETPYNDMLFWAQGEDVELTRRLSSAGITPRYTSEIMAFTDLTRGDQVSIFERLPFESEYLAPKVDGPYYIPGELIIFDTERAAPRAFENGVSLPRFWSSSETGLSWTGNGTPQLSIRPAIRDHSFPVSWLVTFGVMGSNSMSPTMELLVNGKRATLESVARDSSVQMLQYRIVDDLIAQGHSFAMQFPQGLTEGSTLRSVHLAIDCPPISLPAELHVPFDGETQPLLEGWYPQETWGVWTRGNRALLHLPIAGNTSRRDLIISCTVRPFLSPSAGAQRVVVSAGGAPLEIWVFNSDALTDRVFRVPAELAEGGNLSIGFDIAWPTAPREVGGSEDSRLLGLGLTRICVRESAQGPYG